MQTTIITAASLLEMTEDDRISTLKGEVESTASKYITIGKMVSILDRTRPDSGTLIKYLAAKIPGLTTQKLGHGYKAAIVYTEMVSTDAPVGSGYITEEVYDSCMLSWLIPVSAMLNAMEKDSAKFPAEKVAEIRERIAVVLRTRPDAATALLDLIKTDVVPKAQKGEATGSEKEKELSEKLAAKEKEMEDGKVAFDNWKKEAEENAKRFIAKIAELTTENASLKERVSGLETTNGKLAKVSGMLAAYTTEEMHDDLMPAIAGLPETVRTTLLGIVAFRLEQLDAKEPAKAGGTLLIEDAA